MTSHASFRDGYLARNLERQLREVDEEIRRREDTVAAASQTDGLFDSRDEILRLVARAAGSQR